MTELSVLVMVEGITKIVDNLTRKPTKDCMEMQFSFIKVLMMSRRLYMASRIPFEYKFNNRKIQNDGKVN